MQNKGSLLAFTFVLLVMCLGAFAAFSALITGRGSDVVAQGSGTPTEGIASPAPQTTTAVIETPSDTSAQTPEPGPEVSTPMVPSPTPIPPSTPTPLPTATPTAAPSPTRGQPDSGPPPSEQFRVTRNERDCSSGGVIGGWVYDAAGGGLPWANLRLYNDYEVDFLKKSEGPPQAGKYEFTIFGAGFFHIAVVDQEGRALSPVLDINYQPDCRQRIDWEQIG